jgi:hypothetical protein
MNKVTIDGREFVANGDTGLVYRRLAGWYGSPPNRAAVLDRPTADGSFGVLKTYRSARSLTFEGSLFSPTPDAAVRLWQQFAAIQSDGVPITISVDDAFGQLSVTGSLDGAATVDEVNPYAANVTAVFVCYDPVKYALPRELITGLPTAGGGLTYNLFDPAGTLDYGANGNLGRVQLTNAGTAEVWPSVRVDGGLADGFFVQRLDTGQTVRYDRVVPLGSWVDIDFATGAVVIDGVSDGSTYLTRGEFFSVPPGAEFDVQFNGLGAASGTPVMTMSIADGYW